MEECHRTAIGLWTRAGLEQFCSGGRGSEVGVSWQKEPALEEGPPCCSEVPPLISGSRRLGPSCWVLAGYQG